MNNIGNNEVRAGREYLYQAVQQGNLDPHHIASNFNEMKTNVTHAFKEITLNAVSGLNWGKGDGRDYNFETKSFEKSEKPEHNLQNYNNRAALKDKILNTYEKVFVTSLVNAVSDDEDIKRDIEAYINQKLTTSVFHQYQPIRLEKLIGKLDKNANQPMRSLDEKNSKVQEKKRLLKEEADLKNKERIQEEIRRLQFDTNKLLDEQQRLTHLVQNPTPESIEGVKNHDLQDVLTFINNMPNRNDYGLNLAGLKEILKTLCQAGISPHSISQAISTLQTKGQTPNNPKRFSNAITFKDAAPSENVTNFLKGLDNVIDSREQKAKKLEQAKERLGELTILIQSEEKRLIKLNQQLNPDVAYITPSQRREDLQASTQEQIKKTQTAENVQVKQDVKKTVETTTNPPKVNLPVSWSTSLANAFVSIKNFIARPFVAVWNFIRGN